jgi:Fur family iron response transcriptional regulator
MDDVTETLRQAGISPSAQRVAVAKVVLTTTKHPSADEVWQSVLSFFPKVSRATIYNTLNLFVEKGLLRQLVLTEGGVVFDPKLEPHHHLICLDSGAIHDVPWESITMPKITELLGHDIEKYQVVLRGRKTQIELGDNDSSFHTTH